MKRCFSLRIIRTCGDRRLQARVVVLCAKFRQCDDCHAELKPQLWVRLQRLSCLVLANILAITIRVPSESTMSAAEISTLGTRNRTRKIHASASCSLKDTVGGFLGASERGRGVNKMGNWKVPFPIPTPEHSRFTSFDPSVNIKKPTSAWYMVEPSEDLHAAADLRSARFRLVVFAQNLLHARRNPACCAVDFRVQGLSLLGDR